ncbi:hypothetical protein D3C72_2409780 [compost metagenome]
MVAFNRHFFDLLFAQNGGNPFDVLVPVNRDDFLFGDGHHIEIQQPPGPFLEFILIALDHIYLKKRVHNEVIMLADIAHNVSIA